MNKFPLSWYTEPSNIRLVGGLLFFFPGIFLVVWGLLELNQDPKFLLVEAIGWLMIVTFIAKCLPSEGYHQDIRDQQYCFWMGFTIPFVNIHWRQKRAVFSSLPKIHVVTNKIDENNTAYLIRVQGKNQGSHKLVRWNLKRVFTDRASARAFMQQIRKNIDS